jgi:hypothetical protein
MVYHGQVCGDVIVLSEGVRLPDGVKVLVEPIEAKIAGELPADVKLRNGIALFESTGLGPAPTLELVNDRRDQIFLVPVEETK